LGCDLSDAWATVYGAKPQITISLVVSDAQKARELLNSEDWISLNNKLSDFIQNFALKVVYAQNSFQI